MNLYTKIKIYSVFQLLSILCFAIIGTIFIFFSIYQDQWVTQGQKWTEWSELFLFQIKKISAVITGILFHLLFVLVASSWIVGMSLLKFKDRNLTDSLFVVFVFIPILSNIIAFLGQINNKKLDLKYSVNKKEEYKKAYKKVELTKMEELDQIKELLKQIQKKNV